MTLVQFQYKKDVVPLGALYLAHGLEGADVQFDLKIYPAYKYAYDLGKLRSFLSKSGTVIAIGCWSDMLPYIIVLLGSIKKEYPEKIIIFGGIGPTEVAEKILNKFKFIDYILKGCGVYTLPKLVKRIVAGDNNLSDIEGLVYRSSSGITSNYYEGYHLNIPDVLPYKRINNIQSYSIFPIFSSFGCPYQCTFCNKSIRGVYPKKVTYRDLNQVIEEIEVIKKLKKNNPFRVFFADEGFVVNRKRVIRLCNLFISKRLGISWECYGRIDRMDEELLKVMSKSGCKIIFYGVESGSNSILKKIKKGFTIEEAAEVLLLSKKYIETVIASFIYLYPFESSKDFLETFFLLPYLKWKGVKVHLQPLTPAKNSDIYLKYKKRLFLSNNVESWCHGKLSNIPVKCIKLIKENPDIFYYYYFYNFSRFNEIATKAESLIKAEHSFIK